MALHVGFGESDVTPKMGSQSPGGFQARRLEAVHDPLKAVAMVITNGSTTLALVGVDVLFMPEEVASQARAKILEQTKIPADCVLVGASHTHGGGPVSHTFGSDPDPAYLDLLVERIAQAVEQAAHTLHDAEVGDGIGHEPSISFNRRFLMRDGRQVTHPGKGNPEIVHSAGPIDPDVGVIAARSPSGQLLGVFVNFACHLTVVGGNGFTADYATYLREVVRAHYKLPNLPVGFLLGSAGDVTQVDNLRPGREFGEDWARMMGLALGAEVIQTVARMGWNKDLKLAARRTIVPIPIRTDAEEPPETPRVGLGSGAETDRVYARERLKFLEERGTHPVVDCEVQALRIGDLGIATNGAEFFCQLGLDIKAASPFRRTWVVSLANQWIGYVPTPTAYFSGGYEPRTARSAKMSPRTGPILVKTAVEGLKKLVQA